MSPAQNASTLAQPQTPEALRERFVVAQDAEGRTTVEDRDEGRFVNHTVDWSPDYAQTVADDLNGRPRGATALHWMSASEQAPWMSLGEREVL